MFITVCNDFMTFSHGVYAAKSDGPKGGRAQTHAHSSGLGFLWPLLNIPKVGVEIVFSCFIQQKLSGWQRIE